jgi:hypothetical protein
MSCAKEDHVNRFRVFSSASSSLRCRRTTSFTTPHKQRYFVSFFLSSRNLVCHATTLPHPFPRATSFTPPQRHLVSVLAQPRIPRHNATSSLSSRDALEIQSCFALAS